MEWITTSTILERLRDFDDRAMWTTFLQRFERPLRRFAARMGLPAAHAEDVTQEVLLAFAAAYRRGDYDRGKGRLSAWLFGIAYRQAANARRTLARERAKRAADGAPTPPDEVPDERTAGAWWDREWEQALLNAALRQVQRELSPQTLHAFELVVQKGRSPKEAAAELNISRDTVYLAKHRVLRRLAELLRDHSELNLTG